MKGVYIKGMEMPKNCSSEYCPIISRVCTLYSESSEFLFERRHPDCPLVEVPDHGDLIDRDEVMKKLMKKHSSWFYEGDEVCESIKAAPAVIPGDTEEAR